MKTDDVPRIELSVPRSTQYLGMVRKVVAMAAQGTDFPADDVDKIELAIDEACSNAVLHKREGASESLRVEVEITPECFVVTLREGPGQSFPFEQQGNFRVEEQLARPEAGGLGIYIIKNFMDEVRYEHTEQGGNVLTMVKRRRVAAPT